MNTRASAVLIRFLLVALLGLPMLALGAGRIVAQETDCAPAATPIGGEMTASPGAAAAPAASPSDGGELNIAFLPKDVVNNYFANSFQGAEEAAAELEGQVKQVGPDTPNAAEQVTFIQSLTQEGVGAIAVSANDPNALAPALQEAMEQGIKVVSFDSDVAPDARHVFVNQADSEQIGRIQVQIMGRLLGCEGQIAVLSAAATATNQNAWIGFMEDELTKPGYEGMELVEIAYGDDEPQKSYDTTAELLTAYPDLRGIIAPTSVGIAAAAAALEDNERTDVALTGLGLPNELRDYVKRGTIQEFALWNPVDLYYLTFYTAAALISGEITGAPGETYSAGKLGAYTIGENSAVLLGPPFIFDAENIDQFDF
ncbi:MAG: rhamnose ABC transporter substrate-binding protein [Thermomicrobiales bacterium]